MRFVISTAMLKISMPVNAPQTKLVCMKVAFLRILFLFRVLIVKLWEYIHIMYMYYVGVRESTQLNTLRVIFCTRGDDNC